MSDRIDQAVTEAFRGMSRIIEHLTELLIQRLREKNREERERLYQQARERFNAVRSPEWWHNRPIVIQQNNLIVVDSDFLRTYAEAAAWREHLPEAEEAHNVIRGEVLYRYDVDLEADEAERAEPLALEASRSEREQEESPALDERDPKIAEDSRVLEGEVLPPEQEAESAADQEQPGAPRVILGELLEPVDYGSPEYHEDRFQELTGQGIDPDVAEAAVTAEKSQRHHPREAVRSGRPAAEDRQRDEKAMQRLRGPRGIGRRDSRELEGTGR